jgi:UDP-N-acetylglucosamine:LPS N-acetylglucosamine transferase
MMDSPNELKIMKVSFTPVIKKVRPFATVTAGGIPITPGYYIDYNMNITLNHHLKYDFD